MMNRREMLKNMLLITAAIPVLGMGIVTAAPVETVEVKQLSSLGLINQRRLLLKIRETLGEVYMNFIEANRYQPLDDITRHMLQSYMQRTLDYFVSKRVLYDYKVICNETNNSPLVIDNSNLPMTDTYLKLTRSVNIHHIRIGPDIT